LKYLIAGLGNIGEEYNGTRHNIGFDIVDHIASEFNISFEQGRHAFYGNFKHKGRNITLIKPTTYMNLSGKAVKYWLNELKIATTNLLVVVDDVALPFGQIRLKDKGSDGGHNGLKSINLELNLTLTSPNYARLRFGIGNDFPRGRQVDYVLGKWSKEEQEQLQERVNIAKDACLSFCTIGTVRTMNQFNNK